MLLNECKVGTQDSAYAGLLKINKHVVPMIFSRCIYYDF